MNNERFAEILEKYNYLCDRWYKTIKYRIRIDKDHFKSEFYYILFKATLRYNSNDYGIAFEKYLNASLKKLFITYKRKTITNKSKVERKTVPLCGNQHFIVDDNLFRFDSNVTAKDILQYSKQTLKDKGLLELKYKGYTINEVCDQLNISPKEYRNILSRIQNNSVIKDAFEDN